MCDSDDSVDVVLYCAGEVRMKRLWSGLSSPLIRGPFQMVRGSYKPLTGDLTTTAHFLTHLTHRQSFLASGYTLRCCIPLGLNISTPFHHRSEGDVPTSPAPSILPEPQTLTNHEMRRNMFWIGTFTHDCCWKGRRC